MALRFKCTYCSEEVIVEWLNVGERAECYACKRKSLIPENAVEIKSVNETRHQELQKIAKKLRKQVVVDDLIFNTDYKNKTAEKVWNNVLAIYFCSNCDNHAEWINEKCSNCGAIFQQPGTEDKENPDLICSPCNFVQKNSTATFCINCGAALFPKKKVKVNECPTCKTHYEISDKFCDKDGNKLKLIEIEVDDNDNPNLKVIKSLAIRKTPKDSNNPDEVKENSKTMNIKLPMNWYKFLTYVMCPFGIIGMIVLMFRLSDYVDHIVIFSLLFDCLLIGIFMFGLHNKTTWSWKMLLGLYFLNSLFGRIEKLDEWGPFVYLIFVIIVNAFTTYPSYIYFNKRKHLFVN